MNLIGEHTDYNQGLVLPIALEMACYVAAAPASHGNLRVYSSNLKQTREWPAARIGSVLPEHDWGDYVAGVAQQLARAGYAIAPCDLYIRSEVPEGAGLSSSASLEVATALALLGRPEHRQAGASETLPARGIAVRGHAVRNHGPVRFRFRAGGGGDSDRLPQSGVSGGQAASGDPHDRGELDGEARTRIVGLSGASGRMQRSGGGNPEGQQRCREPARRDSECFKQVQDNIPPTPRKRARHIITENERVAEFSTAAAAGDLAEMGRLFLASHRSMQHDYEISCEELDFLVETAASLEGVEGARMTGGGFGGCTVNLVRPDAIDCFRKKITGAYEERFRITPLFYECTPAPGAGRLY